eukprot:snap_masked-scaffold759_size101470-processed-gene-0.15 protein:Tk05119 transcript:snap_masked-scaffold759_size101470-processed-gene-0.15-mRNA-1 annotation:"hypothetical protein Y032_0012g1687"
MRGSNTLRSNSSLSSSSLTYVPSKMISASVVFLDDTAQIFEVDKKAKGSVLLQKVFHHLEPIEPEYFGLMFNNTGSVIMPPGHAPDVMSWLDPDKPIRKQMRGLGGSRLGSGSQATPMLFFRVKFYATDPSRLIEDNTSKNMYLQVKRDLQEGRLAAAVSTLVFLASYSIQAKLGDFDPEKSPKEGLLEFLNMRDSNNQPGFIKPTTIDVDEVRHSVSELHRNHRGQSPAEAIHNFLELSRRLETYGIALHNGKDSTGKDIQLGVTSTGLVVFKNEAKINTFSWGKIVKISFKRKQFFIQLRRELSEDYDTRLGFNLASYRSCKNLWKSAVEHHTFFRLHSPPRPTRPSSQVFYSLSSKLRQSGRGLGEAALPWKNTSSFSRASPIRRTLPLSLEALHRDPPPRLASPETSSIGSSVHSNGKVKVSAPTLVTIMRDLGEGSNSNSSLAHRAMETFNHKVQSLSTKLPKKAWQEEEPGRDATDHHRLPSDDEGGFLDSTRRISSMGRLSKSGSGVASSSISGHAPYPLPATSTPIKGITPNSLSLHNRGPFADPSSVSVHGGVSQLSLGIPLANGHVLTAQRALNSTKDLSVLGSTSTISNGSACLSTAQIRSLGTTSNDGSDGKDSTSATSEIQEGLVHIKILPDDKGRFGFNVKGGADQETPIIVSKVGHNTPADKCFPKLTEGDQVVLINNRDVSGHTHEQVVNFIRASSEPHSGNLTLAVKQNVYMGECIEEPEFQYVPETASSDPPHSSEATSMGTDPLCQSMLLLQESIESGAVLGQFEQLYRKNPTLAMSICHKHKNIERNRYRDISPYDSTRVILNQCPTGDYINGNHVNMNIPGLGIINRYVATQGPLSGTCVDFWYMTWECQSTLIIMLTTIVERGRIKCHKYWPDVGETLQFEGGLSVKCTKAVEKDSFAFRDFEMSREGAEEETEVRHITQMAYLSWPDHGVPESPDEFIGFVQEVRQRRQASFDSTIVHCSAGIGRTGVLILMETAMCLIEANQPIYPLDLTKQMRDQRASMVQTAIQYKFVCEAILQVYKSGVIKPLPEFCQS